MTDSWCANYWVHSQSDHKFTSATVGCLYNNSENCLFVNTMIFCFETWWICVVVRTGFPFDDCCTDAFLLGFVKSLASWNKLVGFWLVGRGMWWSGGEGEGGIRGRVYQIKRLNLITMMMMVFNSHDSDVKRHNDKWFKLICMYNYYINTFWQ